MEATLVEHLKVKPGRGARGKASVFGLLKHNGKVFTVVIPDAKTETLMPIIRQKVKPRLLAEL